MKIFPSSPRAIAWVAIVFAAIPGIVMAGPITVDGVRDVNDAYTNSFIANWTNEHHKDGSIYQDGTQQTTVWWEANSGYFYLYVEVPLWAKNMIWGTGVTAEELALYDVHNMSLGHHGTLSGIDYGKATGSEKAIFAGITADLDGTASGTTGGKKGSKKGTTTASGASGLVSSATSLDYLLDNNICDLTDCAATTTTMSFEFEFDLSADEFEALRDSISQDGIQFHLSPERGLLPVTIPTPATLPVMILGILLLIAASRRRIQTSQLQT